jgi:hypothetical protein
MDERLRSSRMAIVSAVSAISAYCKEHAGAELPEAMVKQLNMQLILASWLAVRCQASIFRLVKLKMEYLVLAAKLR